MDIKNKKVGVIGGGTSGALTAFAISKFSKAKVDLYLDPNIKPQSVGEGANYYLATELQSRNYFDQSLLEKIGGTKKFGINKIDFSNGGEFMHEFQFGTHSLHFDSEKLRNYILNDYPLINVIEKNVKICLENKVNFHVSCTTNIFNVLHVPEFYEHMKDLGVSFYSIHLNNILTNPHHYNINILPDNLKQEVKKRYIRHLKSLSEEESNSLRPKYESIFNFMDEPLEEPRAEIEKTLKYFTELLDDGREEEYRFLDIVPEYTEWYNSIPYDKSLKDEKPY